jgi:hypothetical protein
VNIFPILVRALYNFAFSRNLSMTVECGVSPPTWRPTLFALPSLWRQQNGLFLGDRGVKNLNQKTVSLFPARIRHVPFSFWLVDLLRPRTVPVTWKGDEYVEFYAEGVYLNFATCHDQCCGAFSQLVRSTFYELRATRITHYRSATAGDSLSRNRSLETTMLHSMRRHLGASRGCCG